MSLLEDVKRISEKATAWERPEDPRQLLRDRQPQTYRFKDDGLIPNRPKWPLVIYKSVVRLPQSLDPAAVFEELFEKNGLGEIPGATVSTITFTISRRARQRPGSVCRT